MSYKEENSSYPRHNQVSANKIKEIRSFSAVSSDRSFKLKHIKIFLNTRLQFLTVGVIKHQTKPSREVANSPTLEILSTKLENMMGKLF